MKPDTQTTSAATISGTNPLTAFCALLPLPPSLLPSVYLLLPPSAPLLLIKLQCRDAPSGPMQNGTGAEKRLPVSFPSKPTTDAPFQTHAYSREPVALQISHITT